MYHDIHYDAADCKQQQKRTRGAHHIGGPGQPFKIDRRAFLSSVMGEKKDQKVSILIYSGDP